MEISNEKSGRNSVALNYVLVVGVSIQHTLKKGVQHGERNSLAVMNGQRLDLAIEQ